MKPLRRAAFAVAIVMLAASTWQFADAALIHAKAWLAQQLLQRAWQATLAGQQHVRPWPWADHWPIARLQVPHLQQDLIVLTGAGGNSLAFAPGHLSRTASPGARGVCVISAHRDTHFRFLQQLHKHDIVIMTDTKGHESRYRVIAMRVVDTRKFRIDADTATGRSPGAQQYLLLLTTCYPFDAVLPGGPLRYVVTAEKEIS